MLSVLVYDAVDPLELANTLSALVPGAVEGVLREVVVLDAGAAEARRVADHAGCRVETLAAFAAAAGRLKGDWALVVRSGDRLGPEWVDLAARHIAAGGGEAGRLEPESGGGNGWLGWLRAPRRALLVPKAHLVAHLRAQPSLDGLARGLRVRRLHDRRRR